MLFYMNVASVVGPACNVVCEAGAALAAHWDIPMISYGCALPDLSDKVLNHTHT